MKITPVAYHNISSAGRIFIPLFKKQPLGKEEFFSYLPHQVQETLGVFLKKEFRAEEGEIKSLWCETGKIQSITLFGLGEESNWNERKNPLLIRRMVSHAKKERVKEFSTPFSSFQSARARETAQCYAANALMAHFDYTVYKKMPEGGWPEVASLSLLTDQKMISEAQKGIDEGVIIGEETNACRALANTPGSDMTPSVLANEAKRVAKKTGVAARIMEEREMKRLGMGGVLGVAKGSDEKPKFIILEYLKGPKNQKPLALVGKGVTFDSGGVNLKPEQYMYEMHMDMSGGAAVIHGIAAIARLRLPVNVIGLIPAVENMPSGSSYRPGDLLKSLSGKIIEVLNTDAEGRVILSDALTYALRYQPGLIADFATLTGAAHVALGNYCSALFTNREALQTPLTQIGKNSGDYVWPLPLWDEYLSDIKGVFGDLTNIGKQDRYGGAIHGAKFLEQFVENTPWAHLDIAPKMTTIESEYLAKGASGVGVRYIVELAKEYPRMMNQREIKNS